MSDLPPSSHQSPSAMPGDAPDQLLKQGLAALQHTDYARATRYFSQLARDRQVPGSVRLKAHIGWIKALRGQGQTEAAIALCQKLTQHPQVKVRQWAIATLSELTPTAPTTSEPDPAIAPAADPASGSDLSGFRPLDADATAPPVAPAPAAPSAEAAPTASAPADLTSEASESEETAPRSGFQPLAIDADTAIPPADPPIADRSPADTAAPAPPQLPAEIPESPTESPVADRPIAADDAATALPTSTDSLFHYEHLNQVTADESPRGAEAPAPAAPMAPEPSAEPPLTWLSDARLDRPKALPPKPIWRWQAWISQGICAIVTFWLCRAVMRSALGCVSFVLTPAHRVLRLPIGWLDQDCTVAALGLLVALCLTSPWLLDWLLQTTAGLRPLSVKRLQRTHPEGCRLLRRVSQRQGWLVPLVQELPTTTPLIFSYGWLPRYNRIVVSRGLLDQFSDDEVATLIGYELAHSTTWTLPWMSAIAALLQLCHQGYWQTAQWGDRQTRPLYRFAAAIGTTLGYALYWLFRKANVLAARSRVLLSDRQAVAQTGNPNALMRAVVKLETGIAEAIVAAGQTPPLVESTDLLTPVGYEAAIGRGSLFPQVGFLSAIAWDIHNPYRRWLSLNSSHPGLGERLRRLTGYATQWRLAPALPLPEFTDTRKAGRPNFGTNWAAFLTQISPYLGPLLGVVAAMVLWFLGGVFEPLGLRRVGWIYGDRSVLWGSLLLGLGMGIMVRINPYFPDITAGNRLQDPTLPSLYADPLILPTVSQPVRLTGQLLGRSGMANWLCQDLILQTSTGLLKLHFFSAGGALGNLLIQPRHPSEWAGRSLEVQGWYRRGAIAWMDIDRFLTNGKVVIQANHPVWSVALCLSACALGLLILVRG